MCQGFQKEMKVKLTAQGLAQGRREKTHPSLSGTILLLKLKVSQFRNPSILGKVDGWSPYQAGTHIWQQGVKGVLRRPQRLGSSKPDGPEQWRSLAQGDAGKDPSLYISEPLARLGGLRCCSFLFSSLIPSPNFQNIQEKLQPQTL